MGSKPFACATENVFLNSQNYYG